MRIILTGSLILAVGLSAAAEAQGKGRGKGKGRDRGEAAVDIDVDFGIGLPDDRRRAISDFYRSGGFCPPGLAKKNNGCLPPGQARKRYDVGGYLNDDWPVRSVPGGLEDYLPPLPNGESYVTLDGDVLRVANATRRILDAVVILSR